MAAQCAEPDSIVDSTLQRVDASVLVVRRIGLLVGLARHGRDSTECRSIPTAQKNEHAFASATAAPPRIRSIVCSATPTDSAARKPV